MLGDLRIKRLCYNQQRNSDIAFCTEAERLGYKRPHGYMACYHDYEEKL